LKKTERRDEVASAVWLIASRISSAQPILLPKRRSGAFLFLGLNLRLFLCIYISSLKNPEKGREEREEKPEKNREKNSAALPLKCPLKLLRVRDAWCVRRWRCR
jgi:hypothetical protein